jgi:hypothetical protein
MCIVGSLIIPIGAEYSSLERGSQDLEGVSWLLWAMWKVLLYSLYISTDREPKTAHCTPKMGMSEARIMHDDFAFPLNTSILAP